MWPTSVYLSIVMLAGTVCFSEASWAADCKPLRLINSVKMVHLESEDRFAVPVSINGTPERLILDSGSMYTTLSRAVADKIGMKKVQSGVVVRDVAGDGSMGKVKADTIDIGRQHGTNFEFMVDPVAYPPSMAAGVLSAYTFHDQDLDLDFGTARMNVFSQDHCEGRVAYWPERPLAVVPMSVKFGHIHVPVDVDGHQVTAIIDTGSTDSVMSATAAEYSLDLKLGSADTPQTGASTVDPKLKFYSHRFGKLTFEGVTVLNPKIIIMTDRMASHMRKYGTVPTPKLPDLIIGMNILKMLHIYIAFGENKLYITPAGTESALSRKTAPAP